MIDQATRARWRKLFEARTRGPWAVDPLGLDGVITPTYNRRVAVATNHDDAAFIAQSYSGWELTLAALNAAELERDDAKIAIERVENQFAHQMRQALEHSQMVGRTFDELATTTASVASKAEALLAERNTLKLEVDRLRPLADAVGAWVKHRYSPRLLEAWEASGWKSSS